MRFFFATACSVLLVCPAPASGAAKSFQPRIIGFFGDSEVEAFHEKNRTKADSEETEQSYTAFREMLNFGLRGYSYHPNFLIFMMKVSGGLEEERFRREDSSSSWQVGSAETFEVRGKFLPRHPYNLELFSVKSQPLLAGSSIQGGDYDQYQSGAILRYRKRPWRGLLSYTSTETETETLTSETDGYRAAAGYTLKNFDVNSGFYHTDSLVSDGEEVIRDEYYVDNRISYSGFILDSEWRVDEKSENEDIFAQESWRRRWKESLAGDLPWNFWTTLSSLQLKETNETSTEGVADQDEFFLESSNYLFALRHRLYQSLTSAFAARRTDTEASGGDSTLKGRHLNFNYTKQIYGGNRLSTSLFTDRSETEQEGAPGVIEEAQEAVIQGRNGVFTIDNTLVDLLSIRLEVVDPLDPSIAAGLVEGIHYTVDDLGPFVRVTIFDLPGPTFDIANVDQYTYLASYSLEQARFRLQTDTWGYSVRFDLFDNTLSPYYHYSSARQELKEGILTEPPDQLDIHTAGLVYRLYPIETGIEHQRTESILFPERRWTYYAQYRRKTARNSDVTVYTEREDTQLLEGEGRPENFEERTEHLTLATISYGTRFPNLGISVNAGASYSLFEGLAETDHYRLHSGLRWMLGKSEIDLKATYGRSESTSLTGGTTERDDLSFHFRFSRKLF